MKDGARVLGIDDASFSPEDERTELVGVIYRGAEFVEDVRFTEVEVDGADATEKILELYDNCNNPEHVQYILLDGLCVGGFNPVDIVEVEEQLGKPVIAVTSNEPDRQAFLEAAERANAETDHVEKLDDPEPVELAEGTAYVQFAGVGLEEAREVVEKTTVNGTVPEPVRLAHLIGSRIDKPV